MEEANYSKREHDSFRAENKQQHETVMAFLRKLDENSKVDREKVAEICQVVAENSEQISDLIKDGEKYSGSFELVQDVAKFSKVTKWIFYFILGSGALYSTIKVIVVDTFLINK